MTIGAPVRPEQNHLDGFERMASPPPGEVVVDHLTYRYPASPGNVAPTLRDVSFHVESGRLLGILGASGSGKTTLCLALNGIVPRRTGGTIAGRVSIGGWDTRHRSIAEMATRVGMVFQEPEGNFLGLAVEDEIAFGPENLGVPPAEIARRVDWALACVGMSEYYAASPSHLSGGQKQRVAIAAALAMQPAVLVLDEPTAALDPVGAAEVLTVLGHLRTVGQTTIILVSQDADLLAAHADQIIVLDAGSIVAAGLPHEVFAPERLAELSDRGLPTPAVGEIALDLNRRLGTNFAFLTDEQAQSALAAGLATASSR
jgi:energy-coupling factor transporter ATP-binding protein EcfA2